MDTGDGYRLADEVRRCVRFKQGNVLDEALPTNGATYDITFCRNLLIYFDSATQQRAVGLLRPLLRATGVLFVGPSEAGLLAHGDLFNAEIPQAFAFRNAVAAARRPAGTVLRRTGSLGRPLPPPPARGAAPIPAQLPAKDERRLSLDEIRCFADQGQLAEAGRRCEEYLQ
jgi:chemotaxis protein methyltransferase WspC